MEDVHTLKDVPADESGSSTNEEHVEEQQSDEVEPKLVPVHTFSYKLLKKQSIDID